MANSIVGLAVLCFVLFTIFGVSKAIPLHRAGNLRTTNSVSCNFTSSLCGWTGTVSGGQWTWTTDSALNIRPPEGYAGFAYVTSKHESWAELRSEPFSLTGPRILSFFILQQKFELSANTVELVLHPSGGSDVLIGSYRNAVNWRYNVMLLCPNSESTTTQLVFRFKVGSERNLAAVAGVVLSENANPESIKPPPLPDTLLPIIPGNNSTTDGTSILDLVSTTSYSETDDPRSVYRTSVYQTCVNRGPVVQLWR